MHKTFFIPTPSATVQNTHYTNIPNVIPRPWW